MQTHIGIDLSYTATGIAMTGHQPSTFGTKPGPPHHERALTISGEIQRHLALTDGLICIEGGVNRSQAAFNSGILHGVVRCALRSNWHRVRLIPPATVKKYATGKGNVDKVAVIVAARERLGIDTLDDNEADAAWLLAIAHDLAGDPVVDLPKTHRSALDKLEAPA